MKYTLNIAIAALAISAGAGDYSKQPVDPKQPVPQRGVVGEIGIGLGVNWVNEEGDDTQQDLLFSTINGSIAFPVGNFYTFAFDAYGRWDDFASTNNFENGDDPEFEHSVAGHFLRDLDSGARLGLFTSYGDAIPQSGNQGFDVLIGGVEYQRFLSENVLFFLQLGMGDKTHDDGSDEGGDEGFNSGYLGRAGVTYFMNERTAITLDFEYAQTQHYIDRTDNGEFWGVTLGGETRLAEDSPFYLTYFARHDNINATTENDQIHETSMGVGIKYLFGAGSSKEAAEAGKSIGTPRLPLRASAWTEQID